MRNMTHAVLQVMTLGYEEGSAPLTSIGVALYREGEGVIGSRNIQIKLDSALEKDKPDAEALSLMLLEPLTTRINLVDTDDHHTVRSALVELRLLLDAHHVGNVWSHTPLQNIKLLEYHIGREGLTQDDFWPVGSVRCLDTLFDMARELGVSRIEFDGEGMDTAVGMAILAAYNLAKIQRRLQRLRRSTRSSSGTPSA